MSARSEAAKKATHDEAVKVAAALAQTGPGALIRGRRISNDDYSLLDDDAPLPAAGKVIVSWNRWQQEHESLRAAALQVGVRIPNTLDLAQSWSLLEGRPLIALEFPAFPDGRAYSQARLLRDRYGYAGEIRATGSAVVRDQLQGMERCGIDAFELRADQDVSACIAAFDDFSTSYQTAADGATSVFRRRRA